MKIYSKDKKKIKMKEMNKWINEFIQWIHAITSQFGVMKKVNLIIAKY